MATAADRPRTAVAFQELGDERHDDLILGSGIDRTQAEVARAVGITQPYLAHIESGRHEPSLVVLRNLARALRTPVHELLREGEGERSPPAR